MTTSDGLAKARFAVVLRVLILLLFSLPGRSIAQHDLGGFEGVWEGTLTVVADYRTAAEDSQDERDQRTSTARFRIDGEEVGVYFRSDRRWERLRKEFRFSRAATNALIYGASYGPVQKKPGDGWVETHVYSVTKKEEDVILVFAWRVVNNSKPVDEPYSKFALALMGEMDRVED